MKQVKVNNILYVLDNEAYEITEDTNVDIIYVPEDSYNDYVELNPTLELTRYNYRTIRVTKPEYDVPEPPTPTKETRLVITYNVESTAQPTVIYAVMATTMAQPNLGINDFSAIEIDGVDVAVETIDNSYGTYNFTTTGEHIVKYTLKGNSLWDSRFYSQTQPVGHIKSIYIPSTLTSIINVQFDTSFTEYIVIDSDNQKYTSNGEVGNCIVDKTTNILMCGSNNLVIPDGVVEIADSVGYGQGIENLVIPNSVTKIGEECFMSSSLVTLTIGSGVTSIGGESFTECKNLTTVTIYGTNDFSNQLAIALSAITTLYVDSSMISTYESMKDDYGYSFNILPIPTE